MDKIISPVDAFQLTKKNHRLKITLSLSKTTTEYSDEITDISLLEKINKFISLNITQSLSDICNTIFQLNFEKTQSGICLNTTNIFTNEQIQLIKTIFDIVIINQTYHSEETMFSDTFVFLGIKWYYSIDSFVQCSCQLENEIHKVVQTYLNQTVGTNLQYFGLGGETGFYAKLSLQNKAFTSALCVTNNEIIYQDCKKNIHQFTKYTLNKQIKSDEPYEPRDILLKIVDYDTIQFKDHVSDFSNCVLLINMRKKGFTDQIKREVLLLFCCGIKFKKIIYVGCSSKTIAKDISFLNSCSYQITNIAKFKIQDYELFFCLELC